MTNLVTIKDAAAMLAVHPNTIRNYIKDGRLQAHRIGVKLIRIDLQQLETLKAAR